MLNIINYIVKRAMILVLVVSCYPAPASAEGPAESTPSTSVAKNEAADEQQEPSKEVPTIERIEAKVAPKEIIVSYGLDATMSVFAVENQEVSNDEIEITPVFVCTKYGDTPVERGKHSKPITYDDINDREWVIRGLELSNNVVSMEPLERCILGLALVELDRASGVKTILKGSSIAFGLISDLKVPIIGNLVGDNAKKIMFDLAEEEDLDSDDALGVCSITLTNAGLNGLEYRVTTGPKTELVSVTQEGRETPSDTKLSSGNNNNSRRKNTFNFNMIKRGSYHYKITIDVRVDRSEKEAS